MLKWTGNRSTVPIDTVIIMEFPFTRVLWLRMDRVMVKNRLYAKLAGVASDLHKTGLNVIDIYFQKFTVIYIIKTYVHT
jgi:hypothetical protein